MPSIILVRTPSKIPGRTGWEIHDPDTGQNLCSGFCDEKKLALEANAGLTDAMLRPYEEIKKTFIRLGSLAAALLAVFVISTGYQNGTVNLRACPSKACPVVAVLEEGDVVLPAMGTGESWANVHTAQGNGWIYGAFMEYQP